MVLLRLAKLIDHCWTVLIQALGRYAGYGHALNEGNTLGVVSFRRVQLVKGLFAAWAAILFARLVPYHTLSLRNDITSRAIKLDAYLGVFAAGFGVFVLLLSKGASEWKQRDLLSYGMAEIGFGYFLASSVAFKAITNPSIAEYLAVGSALYVIVRGFNNLADAQQKLNQSASEPPVGVAMPTARTNKSILLPAGRTIMSTPSQ